MTLTTDTTVLSPHLLLLHGAVTTGVLRVGERALLFDCCDTVTPARLAMEGIRHVDVICSTQPRRPHCAGSAAFLAAGTTLVAADAARTLYEDPAAYWGHWGHRWEVMSFQPIPQAPVTPLPVARGVVDGDVITWEGFQIHVLALEPMAGSLAYVVEVDGQRVCFCGDYLAGLGRMWELFPFQRTYGDTCGLLDEPNPLLQSLQILHECGADVCVPSHGEVLRYPAAAIALTQARVDALRASYQETMTGDQAMEVELPDHVFRVPDSTSFLVKADNGEGPLIDCGDDRVVWNLLAARAEGVFSSISAVYLSHYHCDHVWGVGHLCFYYPDCTVLADTHLVDVLRHPQRYQLPCLPHRRTPVTRPLQDGECWQWHEYTLTNYHFPGQTLYHDALLVEGHGQRLLFTGDSLGMGMWLVDYCAYNRNFIGEGVGYARCLQVLRDVQPDLLFEAHQTAFRWTPEQLETRTQALTQRATLLAVLLARDDPNFGLDPSWVRAYPYEQETRPGLPVRLDTVFTNHAGHPGHGQSAPVLPDGWTCTEASDATIAPKEEGAACCLIHIPANTPSGRYILPLRITWNGRYLGQVAEGIVEVFG